MVKHNNPRKFQAFSQIMVVNELLQTFTRRRRYKWKRKRGKVNLLFLVDSENEVKRMGMSIWRELGRSKS